jgi:hypothetical protein
MGRPSLKAPELCDEIVQRISEGEPLRQICRDEHMPEWRTVYDWVAGDAEFAARIARARELGFDAIAEQALDIADDRDDEPASRRVRVETRLKLLAKWSPKKYGDKLEHEHKGSLNLVQAAPLDEKL